MRSYLIIILSVSVIAISGCASLPDFGRLQGNMDQMLYHMGVMSSSMPAMVNSTQRMAAMAERMERKTDVMIADMNNKGEGAERAVQNYAQAFVDNDRAVLKTLRGIKDELGHMRNNMVSASGSNRAVSQSQGAESRMMKQRISMLEQKLESIAQKLDSLESRQK